MLSPNQGIRFPFIVDCTSERENNSGSITNTVDRSVLSLSRTRAMSTFIPPFFSVDQGQQIRLPRSADPFTMLNGTVYLAQPKKRTQ